MCGYAMTKDITYNLRVCYDSTVRRIKLVTGFLPLMHKEENLKNRVFVVEDNLKTHQTLQNVVSNLFNVVLLHCC